MDYHLIGQILFLLSWVWVVFWMPLVQQAREMKERKERMAAIKPSDSNEPPSSA